MALFQLGYNSSNPNLIILLQYLHSSKVVEDGPGQSRRAKDFKVLGESDMPSL